MRCRAREAPLGLALSSGLLLLPLLPLFLAWRLVRGAVLREARTRPRLPQTCLRMLRMLRMLLRWANDVAAMGGDVLDCR